MYAIRLLLLTHCLPRVSTVLSSEGPEKSAFFGGIYEPRVAFTNHGFRFFFYTELVSFTVSIATTRMFLFAVHFRVIDGQQESPLSEIQSYFLRILR